MSKIMRGISGPLWRGRGQRGKLNLLTIYDGYTTPNMEIEGRTGSFQLRNALHTVHRMYC